MFGRWTLDGPPYSTRTTLDNRTMSANTNTLSISIHLLRQDHSNDTDEDRAKLYTKLSQAAHLANEQLQRHKIWSCGGDVLVFGVNCAEFTMNDSSVEDNDAWHEHLQNELEGPTHKEDAMPHLRGICRYGNDVNDAWRTISLMLELSLLLSSKGIHVAIECLDQDGQLLLIEAADVLPNWVDEDVSQGGVGGPRGCVNRCWIVDGAVRLIPPQKHSHNDAYLGRRDALKLLDGCLDSNEFVVDEVQNAIEARIARTDYTIPKRARPNNSMSSEDTNKDYCGTTHYQIAAAAVPASVACFLQNHSYLVPFLVDSFCNVAPGYLDNLIEEKQVNVTTNNDTEKESAAAAQDGQDNTPTSQNHQREQQHEDQRIEHQSNKSNHNRQPKIRTDLGNHFTYERIVLLPVTMTRATYAELITGRGIVPSFPTPKEYRSVELNRFQRQLIQMRGEKNVWIRSVEIGVRICAGIEWILNGNVATKSLDQESFLQSMGEVERRLRIHWCRIDAEARPKTSDDEPKDGATSWIEQTWRAGPNNKSNNIQSNALQSMAKCHVFHPELSKSPNDEPCPNSRPGVSLHEMTQTGTKRALRWVRDEYSDEAFPFPREWEVDDDSWMEVNTLQELEEEMKKLSSTNELASKRPRRTTRRSRRNLANNTTELRDDGHERHTSPVENNESQEVNALNKMLQGIKTLVEGEGDVGGVVTQQRAELPPAALMSPQEAMSEEININPSIFLNILQSQLRDNTISDGTPGRVTADDQDVSKFFFKEDLEESDNDDSSTESVEEKDRDKDLPSDPQSLSAVMVSDV